MSEGMRGHAQPPPKKTVGDHSSVKRGWYNRRALGDVYLRCARGRCLKIWVPRRGSIRLGEDGCGAE